MDEAWGLQSVKFSIDSCDFAEDYSFEADMCSCVEKSISRFDEPGHVPESHALPGALASDLSGDDFIIDVGDEVDLAVDGGDEKLTIRQRELLIWSWRGIGFTLDSWCLSQRCERYQDDYSGCFHLDH